MTNHPPSVLWHCWLGHQTCKNRRPYNLYCVGADVKPCSINTLCLKNRTNFEMVYGFVNNCQVTGWEGTTREQIKKQTYMKLKHVTSFEIFLPNIITIEPYNFELYHFKFGACLWQCTFIVTNHDTFIYVCCTYFVNLARPVLCSLLLSVAVEPTSCELLNTPLSKLWCPPLSCLCNSGSYLSTVNRCDNELSIVCCCDFLNPWSRQTNTQSSAH